MAIGQIIRVNKKLMVLRYFDGLEYSVITKIFATKILHSFNLEQIILIIMLNISNLNKAMVPLDSAGGWVELLENNL